MQPFKPLAAVLPAFMVAFLLSAPAKAENSKGLVLSYEMWQGGFQPFKIELRLNNSTSDYRAGFVAETSGVVGWAYPYRVQARSQGRNGGDRLWPASFQSAMRKPGDQRSRWITYRDGVPEPRFDPPRNGTSNDEPTGDQIAGTMDPVSGLVSVIDRVRKSGRCAGTAPVYDGKKLYLLHASDHGTRRLESTEYGVFAGEAMVCRVQVQRVAGFRKKKKRFGLQYMPKNLDILMAPVASGYGPVPVRMEGESDLGSIVIHLVSVGRDTEAWEAMAPNGGKKGRSNPDREGRPEHR